MTTLHFPSIEAGRVTSLCGALGASRSSWTTKARAVTCLRCRALLAQSDALDAEDEVRPLEPRRAGAGGDPAELQAL